MKKFYAYTLSLDGTPFYVGKGKDRRWRAHWTPGQGSSAAHEIISQVESTGREVSVELFYAASEADALAAEKKLIKRYGLRKHGGLLVNRAQGELRGGGWHALRRREASLLMKQRLQSPSAKEAARRGSLKRWSNPEEKERASARSKQTWSCPAHKQKMRQVGKLSAQVLWSNPELSQRVSAKISRTLSGHWKCPLFREAQWTARKIPYFTKGALFFQTKRLALEALGRREFENGLISGELLQHAR